MEKRKGISIKDIALIAIMAATLEIGKVALFYLPNIEIVSLLIILYTLFFRKKVFFAIYIFVFLEWCFWGFGLWIISYLYVWSILAIAVLLIRKEKTMWFYAIFSALYGLLFGLLCLLPDLIVGGPAQAAASFISGITFDFLHCVGNFVVTLLLFNPLKRAFNHLKKQYYLETVA